MNSLINKINLRKEIHSIRNDLINDALKSCPQRSSSEMHIYNFPLYTQHTEYLYHLFIRESRRLLNNFTLRDEDFKVWCYLTDENYSQGDTWHNHIRTSTINGVLYLQTVRGGGIEICTDYNVNIKYDIPDEEYNRENIKYIQPNNFDLLIFPNFIDHRPIIPKSKKKRITFNMELRCKEPSHTIFNMVI